MLGRLVSAYIYIGLFMGMALFTITSITLVCIIAAKGVDIVDKIKLERKKYEKES